MNPLQAIRATVYMLLARAREPIGEKDLIPAPSRGSRQRPDSGPSAREHPRRSPMTRRRTDLPSQHISALERLRNSVVGWAAVGFRD